MNHAFILNRPVPKSYISRESEAAFCLLFEGKCRDWPSWGAVIMKRIRYVDGKLDAVDVAILQALSLDARMSVKDLALHIGLSAPSTAERLHRLEEARVIDGYSIRVNAKAAGLPVSAQIRIRPMPGKHARVAELLKDMPEIVEADRVTGDDCFVAKAFVASIDDLEGLIDRLLPFATTNTAVVQSSPVRRRMPQIMLRGQ
jgi:Lrp/AsnC family leucine-responsive transcriptional regulator